MKTLHFETREAPDSIVPPKGSKLFEALPDVVFCPLDVRVMGRRNDGSAAGPELRATALLAPNVEDIEAEEYRTYEVSDGRILGSRPELTPMRAFLVRVDNDSDAPCHARVVVQGESAAPEERLVTLSQLPAGMARRPRPEEWFFGMQPKAETKTRRLRIPPGETRDFTLFPPARCTPRKITMRSDAKFDLDVTLFTFANVNLLCSGPVAVEFFKDGRSIRTVPLEACNRMTCRLRNESNEERYVEIDVDVSQPEQKNKEFATRQ